MAVDSIADLIPVAVVVGYLFLKFAGRSRRPEAPTTERQKARPASRGTAGPTPFEQLLARLEEANGVPRAAAPEPPPLAPPSVAAVPAAKREFSRAAALPESPMFADNRRAVADYEARSATAAAFRSSGGTFTEEARGFDHESHGYGAQNPLSEATFQSSRDADRRVGNANRQAYDPHRLRPAPAVAPRQSIAERLTDPAAIRDAFVLQTVLARRPPLRGRATLRPR